MALRHNTYSQLLGSVENNIQPLVGVMPMTGVPDLGGLADSIEQDAQYHADVMKSHAADLKQVAELQPKFGSSGGAF